MRALIFVLVMVSGVICAFAQDSEKLIDVYEIKCKGRFGFDVDEKIDSQHQFLIESGFKLVDTLESREFKLHRYAVDKSFLGGKMHTLIIWENIEDAPGEIGHLWIMFKPTEATNLYLEDFKDKALFYEEGDAMTGGENCEKSMSYVFTGLILQIDLPFNCYDGKSSIFTIRP